MTTRKIAVSHEDPGKLDTDEQALFLSYMENLAKLTGFPIVHTETGSVTFDVPVEHVERFLDYINSVTLHNAR